MDIELVKPETIDAGVHTVLSSDNIAIVVMFLIILFQWGLVGVLLRKVFQIKDVLSNLILTITVLNERIGHKE